jgi:hypothetical protein
MENNGMLTEFPSKGRIEMTRAYAISNTSQSLPAIVKLLLFLGLLGFLFGCKSQPALVEGTARETPGQAALAPRNVEDYIVVDCLLPGRIKKLGRKVVYVTPRRPIKTTAFDCEIRGGEYVAYDRATYKTALNVWLSKAEEGDKIAQTYVGEIYEKGLGTEPNYVLAAKWYQKAAEQEYARAQMNLGHLYELGLGVSKDMKTAIKWYRNASGLSGAIPLKGAIPSVGSTGELQRLREKLKRREEEVQRLLKKLKEAQEELTWPSDRNDDVTQLRGQIASLEAEVNHLQDEQKKRRPRPPELPTRDFGRYYALIVGNNKYAYLEKLQTAVKDAEEVDRILRKKYGFRTKILKDARRYQLISALHEFRENLTGEDNFLLYYAGHGELDVINKRGYWLTIDAEKKNPANWISNSIITDILNTMSAKHILVIADSCYSGTMTGLSIPHLMPGMPEEVLSYTFGTMLKKRSRTVLTSGGLKPVLDEGGGKHSIFAKVLLSLLEDNIGVIQGKDLHSDVSPRVSVKAAFLGEKQDPLYAALQYVGHEGGDFFFVPTKRLARRSHSKRDNRSAL